jgi:MSHA biogenesis protein MshJ
MKQRWNQLLDRVDALSLRERIFLFLSVFVCLLALVDFVWLTPALTSYKQLTQRFAAQNTELSRLRDELRLVATPSEASRSARLDQEQVDARLAVTNQSIAAALPHAPQGVALELVLAQLLRKQDGLTLLGITTLREEAAASGGAAAGTPGAASALPAGMTRRGLELRVSGPYAELVRYIHLLETQLPSLRWGALSIKGEQQPPELSVQLYLLEVQP